MMGTRKQRPDGNQNDGSKSKTKKKPRVEEINGVLWQLDDNGNPIKKVKKKSKPESEQSGGGAGNGGGGGGGGLDRFIETTGSPEAKKKKPNVKEIDGILWQLDENGNPLKKLRRKGAPRQDVEPLSARDHLEARRRSRSQGPAMARGRRPGVDDDAEDRRLRARSVGGPRQKPGEYIDDKGRKVIIEEDGNKIVFDKNGKRLRPKKKNSVNGSGGGPLPSMNPRSSHDHDHDFMASSIRISGNFDDVWSDKPLSLRMPTSSAHAPPPPPPPPQRHTSPQRRLYQGMSGPPPDDDPSESTGDMNGSTRNGFSGTNGNETRIDNNHTSELSKQIEEYGRENRELKTQLMSAQDEVRTLTQQNQREKARNVKATTEMLQLKADHQQASDEKRNLELAIKNLESRLKEKEDELAKFERTPMNRRISIGAGGGMGQFGGGGDGDHLVSQISDLMAENDALLDKLEFEKASSGHELKKKEEKILFLNEELKRLRAENDMLFRGEAERDPLMAKLFASKKELEERMEKEKEVAKIRIDGMLEMIESLQNANATLRKDLEKATLEIKDEDDEEIRRAKEMAQAVAHHGTRNAVRAKRASIQITSGTHEFNPPQKTFSGFGLNKLSALATAAGRK